jgi:hypothetical protein
MNTIHHERWLTDTFQVRKALAGELLPLAKRRQTGPRNRWSGWSVAIVTADMANKEIAWKLKISGKTVKSHVSTILDRFGLESRTQLATYSRVRLLSG